MNMEIKNRKHELKYVSGIVTCGLIIAAIVFYIIGAAVFGYYNDLNPQLIIILGAGSVLCVVNAILTEKKGDTLLFSLLTVLLSVVFAYALMRLAGARVYSIAVLLLSDLERDNVEGYYALYASIASMGLITMGLISNIVTGFLPAYGKKER